MEDEEIAHVEIRKMNGLYRVDIQTGIGGVRFYEDRRLEKVLKELAFDLNEEFESVDERFPATDIIEYQSEFDDEGPF